MILKSGCYADYDYTSEGAIFLFQGWRGQSNTWSNTTWCQQSNCWFESEFKDIAKGNRFSIIDSLEQNWDQLKARGGSWSGNWKNNRPSSELWIIREV